jgi:disulfide bond formation protein DsbB
VAWSLFGISMAGYNFIYATLCGIAALWAAARLGANRRAIA